MLADTKSEQLYASSVGTADFEVIWRFVFFLVFAQFCFTWIADLAFLPTEMFVPLGVLSLVPKPCWEYILSPWGLGALSLSGIFAAAISIAFPLRVSSALIASLLLLLHEGITRGYAQAMNHAELGLLYVAIIFSVAAFFFRREEKQVEQLRILQYALLLGTGVVLLAYHFVAVERLINGGVSVFFDYSLARWIVTRNERDMYFSFSLGRYAFENPPLGTLAQAGYIVFSILECAAPLALVSKRFRLLTALGLPVFHFGILLSMNLNFLLNATLVPALLLIPGKRT